MEEIKTIMGSETEFAVVPLHGNWSEDKTANKTNQFISLLNYMLNAQYRDNNHRYSQKTFDKANWWNEDIKNVEKEEVARMLGLSGQYAKNGARIYVDGTHPEYSTPECLSPFELIAHEKAGAMIMRNIIKEVEKRLGSETDLLKNNWDYGDSSYSCHENYLLSRRLFHKLVSSERSRRLFHYPSSVEQVIWIAHLVTRQIFTGSGRLDVNKKWPESFSISQRSPFISDFEHLDTTHRRAIINTRDRPYGDRRKFARLHVICGDSNIADWSNLLKYGPSRLILLMLEDVLRKKFTIAETEKYIFIDKPEDIFSLVQNHDKSFRMSKGTESSLSIQLMLVINVIKWLEWKNKSGENVSWAKEVIEYWTYAIDAMSSDESKLDDKLDYKIKKKIFEEKLSLGKDMKKLQSLDYSYHVINNEKSFSQKLQEKGKMKTIISKEDLTKAFNNSPKSRARLRSLMINHLSKNSELYLNPSWHEIFIYGENNRESIEMPDPRDPYAYKTSDKTAILIEELLSKMEGENK